jgi:UDP-glucose 4-epimerase
VIYGDGEQSRDFTYIDNVVAANLSAATSNGASGKVINVANGERITLNELLAELKDLTGKHDVTAEYKDPRVGDVRHSLADNTLAQEFLGYESKVGLREGLQRTIDWWKNSRFSRG